METLTRKQRQERRGQGPKTRLTNALKDQFVTSVRSGAPPSVACDYVGISRTTLAKWMRTADLAAAKRWNDRDQFERLCMVFALEFRQAQGQAGMLVWGTIASAAGMTRERPTRRRTRQIITAGDQAIEIGANGEVSGGRIEQVIIETDEAPPDWRAAQVAGKIMRPAEMGEPQAEPETPASTITGRQVYDRLQQIKQERAELLRRAEPIEAVATVNSNGDEPAIVNTDGEDDPGAGHQADGGGAG
jgi:hypothetical protein